VPGLYKIGFDPAQNLAVLSRKVADKFWWDFFDAERFLSDPDLGKLRPKVVTSIAMFSIWKSRGIRGRHTTSHASGGRLDHADELPATHAEAERFGKHLP